MPTAKQSHEDKAREFGIDVSLLDCNLALPPQERLRQHQEALNLAEALEAPKIKVRNGGTEPAPGKAPRP